MSSLGTRNATVLHGSPAMAQAEYTELTGQTLGTVPETLKDAVVRKFVAQVAQQSTTSRRPTASTITIPRAILLAAFQGVRSRTRPACRAQLCLAASRRGAPRVRKRVWNPTEVCTTSPKMRMPVFSSTRKPLAMNLAPDASTQRAHISAKDRRLKSLARTAGHVTRVLYSRRNC